MARQRHRQRIIVSCVRFRSGWLAVPSPACTHPPAHRQPLFAVEPLGLTMACANARVQTGGAQEAQRSPYKRGNVRTSPFPLHVRRRMRCQPAAGRDLTGRFRFIAR
jgi:hypothetical protein